jgi:hypothetical protein
MRPRLTYANAMATIAVFIALGGASYAALKLPKNSVGSNQLKKHAVTTAKIKKEAVTAAAVKQGALTGTQINESTLGTVPDATHAAGADNAGQVAGNDVSSIAVRQPIPTPLTAIYSEKGLQIKAECTPTGVEIKADVPAQAHLRVYTVDLATPETNPIPQAVEVGPQATASTNVVLSSVLDRDAALHVFYDTDSGQSVSGSFMFDLVSESGFCDYAGHLIAG